jgi:peptidoglycan/LPS O-acetylase OafA/YrhL
VDRRDHCGRDVGQALIGRVVVPTTPLPTDPLTAARRRHPAGRLLAARERHPTARLELRHLRRRETRRFGHQPGLDGLRAVSVIAVICYHAGFGWMRGGWIGVEVFFVVSGFLITTLLLEERARPGGVSVTRFWVRRARRLLPALAVVLAAVAVWALIAGSDQQLTQLRRDYPWALFYAGNWGQIAGGVPYYAADPPLLRHLWSLAIEEQFYLVWPLAFVAITSSRLRRAGAARLVAAIALVPVVVMFSLHADGPGPIGNLDRVNFLYLSTLTRAGGLLAGAAAAFVWRPWKVPARRTSSRRTRLLLDSVGVVAVSALACIAIVAELTAGYVYQWLLPLTSVLSLLVVIVVVHPAAVGIRGVFGRRPLAAIGARSYGLYLWHWPIFVFAGVRHGSPARFAAALAIAVLCSELCYRYVELPVRRGAFGAWWRTAGPARVKVLAAAGTTIAVLTGLYAAIQQYDRAEGGEATFDAPAVTRPAAAPAPAVRKKAAMPAPSTVPADLPRRVAVVGDSQAYSLAANVPTGLDETLTITDGSVVGCSVYDSGSVHSARDGFANSFTMCAGWQDEWAGAVRDSDADVALVVLGAWDVFDVETGDGELLTFRSPGWDANFTSNLQHGIDALTSAGADVAILEVPCMRPKDVEGAGVPALPERGDDARVAHVNELLRAAASANAGTTTFVEGPDEWCDDETVANDLTMRWDGVHVYQPGAALVYEAITPALLSL